MKETHFLNERELYWHKTYLVPSSLCVSHHYQECSDTLGRRGTYIKTQRYTVAVCNNCYGIWINKHSLSD